LFKNFYDHWGGAKRWRAAVQSVTFSGSSIDQSFEGLNQE